MLREAVEDLSARKSSEPHVSCVSDETATWGREIEAQSSGATFIPFRLTVSINLAVSIKAKEVANDDIFYHRLARSAMEIFSARCGVDRK
jgi:hypothetical protein